MDSERLFHTLIRDHQDVAYRFALRLSGNESDAMDLVQESFRRVLLSLDRYDPARPFAAWMHTILRHLYVNGQHRAERRNLSLDALRDAEDAWEPAADDSDRPDRSAEKAELKGAIQRALNALPYDLRAPLILCDTEDMRYEDISRILDCPVNTVRTRIHRARAAFRARMGSYMNGGKVR